MKSDDPIQFSHSGARYLLGYGADFFGIWDREVPGPPIHRFPRTDGGWVEAWQRYSALEPNSAEVGLTPSIHAGPASQAAVQRTSGLAVASLVLGIVGLVFIPSAILALVFGYTARSRIRQSGEGGAGMAFAGIVLGWIEVAVYIAYVILAANDVIRIRF